MTYIATVEFLGKTIEFVFTADNMAHAESKVKASLLGKIGPVTIVLKKEKK